jgi:hypothetical protein
MGLAFAAMPWIIATVAAILRFGSAVTASDILGMLFAAGLATPL